VEYAGGVLCQEHFEQVYASDMVDEANEAIGYIDEWLSVARERENAWLERTLLGALEAAQAWGQKGLESYEAARVS